MNQVRNPTENILCAGESEFSPESIEETLKISSHNGKACSNNIEVIEQYNQHNSPNGIYSCHPFTIVVVLGPQGKYSSENPSELEKELHKIDSKVDIVYAKNTITPSDILSTVIRYRKSKEQIFGTQEK